MDCGSVSTIGTMLKRLVKLRVWCFVRQRRASHYEEGQNADPMVESCLHSGDKEGGWVSLIRAFDRPVSWEN